jgi:hypothetical protein
LGQQAQQGSLALEQTAQQARDLAIKVLPEEFARDADRIARFLK